MNVGVPRTLTLSWLLLIHQLPAKPAYLRVKIWRRLRRIAEIIHDIDLKDDKFGRTEVAGIRTLIDGIRASTSDDARRIERGSESFNDLYEFFRKKRR